MQLIKVITNCSIGKIYETEVKCQSLLSLGHIRQHLLDDINLREIKATLVVFLEEVWTELSVGIKEWWFISLSYPNNRFIS